MKVKICGITHPDDARFAAKCGADFIGINFSKRSKRRVSIPVGKEIVQAIGKGQSKAVGIFVDETAEQIAAICQATGIRIVQLHGQGARSAFSSLQRTYTIFYAMEYDKAIELPHDVFPLYDNMGGGKGVVFDWKKFTPPKNHHWFLAGGLNPENVGEAIRLLHPYGVDAASGVEFPQTVRKDPNLIKAFIDAAKEVKI